MTTRGFILGKFLPPHRGHLFLCETAQLMTDELTVLVCSTDFEPIDGVERFLQMRAMLPAAHVVHLHKNLPQEPKDDPHFWQIWREEIRAIHPEKITYVFASEPYVFRLADELGASPVLVDPDREIFSISGASVRAGSPPGLPPPQRTSKQVRLTILGPESVGKTRLAADLAAHFGTLAMPEYGRIYDLHYKQGKNWRSSDFVTLAKTHQAMREAMRRDAGPLLIEDTDAVQTAIWSLFLVQEVDPALAMIERSSLADHYLVLTPDVEWIQDGVRYAGDRAVREFFFDEATRRLRSYGANFDTISGADWPARRSRAIAIAERRLNSPPQSSR